MLIAHRNRPELLGGACGIADCCSFLYMYWEREQGQSRSCRRVKVKGHWISIRPVPRRTPPRSRIDTAPRITARRAGNSILHLASSCCTRAHYFYARACFTERKLEEAVSHYRDAWRVRPEDYQAISYQPIAGKTGWDDEAMKACTAGNSRWPTRISNSTRMMPADGSRGGALMHLGKREQALETGTRAFAIDRKMRDVLYNLVINALAVRQRAIVN